MLTPKQYQCCSWERLWVVVDLKRGYRNIRNEWICCCSPVCRSFLRSHVSFWRWISRELGFTSRSTGTLMRFRRWIAWCHGDILTQIIVVSATWPYFITLPGLVWFVCLNERFGVEFLTVAQFSGAYFFIVELKSHRMNIIEFIGLY